MEDIIIIAGLFGMGFLTGYMKRAGFRNSLGWFRDKAEALGRWLRGLAG